MANAKIMIVESDIAVAKDIEERLTTLGYTICAIVSSKTQTIAKVVETRPDLVLIDTDVEGEMDGVDIAQEIYNRFDIPVIYLTNYVNEDLLKKVRTTRAFGHVFKPYGTDQLHLSIENHLYWYQEDQQFRKGEQQLTTICNNISDAVIATDLKGSVTFMNPAAESLTGWQLEDASGVNIKQVLLVDTKKDCPVAAVLRSILHPDTATAPDLSTDSPETYEGRLTSRSDQDIQVSYNAVPWTNQSGEGIGVVITCRDITAYKAIEEQLNQTIRDLQDQTQLIEAIFNSISDGVVAMDTDEQYFILNTKAQEIIGPLENIPISDRPQHYGLFHPDGKTLFSADELPLACALRGETTDNIEILVSNDTLAKAVSINVSGRPILDEQGNLKGGVIAFHDITQLKAEQTELEQVSDELRNQVKLMETVFNNMNDGIIVLDSEGQIVLVNPNLKQICGLIPRDVDRSEWAETYGIFYPDKATYVPTDQMPITRALRGETIINEEFFVNNEYLTDGIHVISSAFPLLDENQQIMGSVGITRDITKEKTAMTQLEQTMQELKNQVQLTDTIFNSISDGVVAADANGAFTIFNPSAEKIIGIGATETGPDEWSDNYGLFFPDRVTPFPTDELPLTRALRGEALDEVDMFVRNPKVPDGVFISVSGRPLRDKTGTDKGGVIMFRDVTHQIIAEEALTQAFAQGRLEIVETILHNIGNAINSVTVGLNVLQENVVGNQLIHRFSALADMVKAHQADWDDFIKNDPKGRQVLPFMIALASDFTNQNNKMVQTLERVNERVTHIIDIVRTQKSSNLPSMTRKTINLQQAIWSAVKLQQDSIGKRGIQVDVDCENAPQEIQIQESQFQQMLVNLLKNSIEAIDELMQSDGLNETPRIEIKAYTNEDFLYLDITDNGIGIEQKNSKLIFAAGYTTKESGTGLGLHSSANFVIGSGGKIYPLSDGIGKGTTMRIMMRCSSILP